MAVEVTPTATSLKASAPNHLFSTPPVPLAVTDDGKRFVGVDAAGPDAQTPITVVLNWEAALKR